MHVPEKLQEDERKPIVNLNFMHWTPLYDVQFLIWNAEDEAHYFHSLLKHFPILCNSGILDTCLDKSFFEITNILSVLYYTYVCVNFN